MIKLMFRMMKAFSLYSLLVNRSILKLSLIEYYKFRLQKSRFFSQKWIRGE